MKIFHHWLALVGIAGGLFLSAGDLAAQQRGRGNQGQGRGGQGRGTFDPAQFRERMLDGYRERLEVKNDDEWKIIRERIEKVLQLQREARVGGRNGGLDRGRDRSENYSGGRTNRSSLFGTEPNPELEALQKALDSKAPPDEVKTKIARLRESLKAREAKLALAQDDLRKVLSMRQEGIAIVVGLLK